jgi:hypothetical protein
MNRKIMGEVKDVLFVGRKPSTDLSDYTYRFLISITEFLLSD